MSRLTLDLVPQTCWFSNLRTELPKDQWDKLRRASYKLAGYKCELCGGIGRDHPVECHEVWSYDEAAYTQSLDRLVSLCPSCHMVKHFGLAQLRGQEAQALRHYAKVNGVSKEQALDEIHEEWVTWQRRSANKWSLNLQVLEGLGVPSDVIAEAEDRRARRNAEVGTH